MKIYNIKTTTEDGLVSKSGKLSDGTSVMYCGVHRRWEWDCQRCGSVNPTRNTFCHNCGRDRKGGE